MPKIMFVCHGNICRSPMAEAIFSDMVKKAGYEDSFIINSSATSSEEIFGGVGNPIYPPALEELKKHKIPTTDHRATKLLKSDYEKYDFFLGMDSANIRNMNIIFGGDKEGKIRKLLSFTDLTKEDVSDPWYSGDFTTAYNDIYEGCRCFLGYLFENGMI